MKKALLLTVAAVVLTSLTMTSKADVNVNIDDTTRHQTIRGWGSVFYYQTDVPDYLRDQIVSVGVEDLGLNCFRYEAPAGWSNEITRWEWLNDDDDPLTINWDAYNFDGLDTKAQVWLVPVKQAVEAQGKHFSMQISPSFFDGGSSGEPPVWLLRNPGEYAEFATTIMLRLRELHGIVPDYYTICNEAGNNNPFSSSIVARMIKNTGPRFEELGFPTRFEFPESINAYAAWASYISPTQNDDRMWQYVDVISYHLYGGYDYRDDLWNFAKARGLQTAQTEFLASSASQHINYFYDDITIANVSEWEVYGMGFPVPNNARTSFTRSVSFWAFRQWMHYVQPGSVRVEATSDNSTMRSLAFDLDGDITTILINTSSSSVTQNVTLSGLPAGNYAVSQSINKTVPQELGLYTVGGDGLLTISVVKNAVMTIYPHTQNLPPNVLMWETSDEYLKLGQSSSTTLSVIANDPELDTLGYTWRVVSTPAGSNVSLATPNSTSCTASGLTAEGLYTFAIDVSDGMQTTTREVFIKVYNGNQLPFVNIHNRIPLQLTLPTSNTTLRVYARDPDDTSFTYQWSIVDKPASANVVFASPNGTSNATTGMTVAGDYVFRCTANDGEDEASGELTVTVFPVNNNAPFIQNPTGQVLSTGIGQLSATTGDADGDWISHWWELINSTTDGNVTFSNQSSPSTDVWADKAGTYQFQLNVVDRTRYVTRTVTLDLPAADLNVLSRHVFYNNSSYDGHNPAAGAADDDAIDTTKMALLPGNTATFTNYTSYDKGINGIIIDLANTTAAATISDFEFHVGNDQQPGQWQAAPAPVSITYRPGEGRFDSDRITIIFSDGAIKQKWLKVTVKANAVTGLPEDDVFYFGNATGDTGNSITDTIVDASDEIAARNNTRHFVNPAGMSTPWDHNRDKKVDATDEIISRNHTTTFATSLVLLTAP